jgi:hypothetical protein
VPSNFVCLLGPTPPPGHVQRVRPIRLYEDKKTSTYAGDIEMFIIIIINNKSVSERTVISIGITGQTGMNYLML